MVVTAQMVNAFDTNELHLQVVKRINFMWYIFCCCCLVAKSRLSNPIDCNLPGSSVYGISQARKLEWVAISFSRGSSWPGDRTWISYTGRQILYHQDTREAMCILPQLKKKMLREKRNLPLPWSQWVMEMESKPRQSCSKILMYVCF